MGSGWKVGRLAGIDISVHPSWLVIAFLITYSLAGSQFPRDFPGWSQDQYWGVSAVTAALFFASVLAHELSHAIVARRFGLKVEGITLFIFGGATTIDADSRTPREEALIAIAGPAASDASNQNPSGNSVMRFEPGPNRYESGGKKTA